LENLIRAAIAAEDRDTHKALLPLYMLLLGACAEARLKKVLMEPNKFTQNEVTQILETNSHKERWLELIKISFLKRESKPITLVIAEHTLNRTAWHIYQDIRNLIENELRVVIELRNKLAHGQFEYPFVNWDSPFLLSSLSVSTDHKRLFQTENLLTMILKRNILDNILNIVRDLGVSEKAFPRDFDKYYRRIQMLGIQIRTKNYETYRDGIISRYNYGKKMYSAR